MTPDSANSQAREARARRLLTPPLPAIFINGRDSAPARSYAAVIEVPRPRGVPARRRQHAARQRSRVGRLEARISRARSGATAGTLLGHLRGATHGARLRRLPRRAAALSRRASSTIRTCSRCRSYLVELPVRQPALSGRARRDRASGAPSDRPSSSPTATWCSSRARWSAPGLWEAVEGRVLIYIHKEKDA